MESFEIRTPARAMLMLAAVGLAGCGSLSGTSVREDRIEALERHLAQIGDPRGGAPIAAYTRYYHVFRKGDDYAVSGYWIGPALAAKDPPGRYFVSAEALNRKQGWASNGGCMTQVWIEAEPRPGPLYLRCDGLLAAPPPARASQP